MTQPAPFDTSAPLSQAELDEGLNRAWRRADFDEAKAWLALGADPMSDPAPLLSLAISNRDLDTALALAPHRWREQGSQDPQRPLYPPLMCCLHLIYFQGHTRPEDPGARLLTTLLEAGVDPNQPSGFPNDISPLRFAVSKNAVHAAGLLIQSGANAHERQAPSPQYSPDTVGDTLIHTATRHWDVDMAQLLVNAGVDPKALNDSGKSAQDLVADLSGRPQERMGAFFANLERQELAACSPEPSSTRPALRM